MVDFSKLEVATWPLRVGGLMVHRSWDEYDAEKLSLGAIRVLYYEGKHCVCNSGHSTYQYKYTESSFSPASDWLYLNGHTERKKKGFGKWFSERSNG